MRILLLSDLHEDEHALECIKDIMGKGSFEYVFITGDFTKRTISYVNDILDLMPDSITFCWALPGNCDPPEVLEILEKRQNSAHGRRITIDNGFNIVGFGLSPPTPFHTYGEINDEEIDKGLRTWKIDGNTLLLTHAPPYGRFDLARGEHVGSNAIRKIIEEKQPFANFCGHVHEHEGVDKIGNTHIVKIPAANSGRYAIATINNRELSVEFLKM